MQKPVSGYYLILSYHQFIDVSVLYKLEICVQLKIKFYL